MQEASPPAVAPDALAKLARAAALVAGGSLVGVAAVEAWQVVARYVLNDAPGWTEPVALLLLNVAMSLGAAAAVHGRAHFGFMVLQQAAPPRVARALAVFSDLVVAGIGLVLAGYGARLAADGWTVPMAGAPLPQSAAFVPLAIGGALMALFALARVLPRRGPESA